MKTMAIFGGTGGLGKQLVRHFEQYHECVACEAPWPIHDYDIISLGSADVDITEYDAVVEFMAKNQPDIIINTAAINIDGTWTRLQTEQVGEMVEVNIKGFSNNQQ